MGAFCITILMSSVTYNFRGQKYMLNRTEYSDIIPELNISVVPCGYAEEYINETNLVGSIAWNENQIIFLRYIILIGRFLAPLPSAYIAENYSAKWLLFVDMFINGFVFLASPYMAYNSYVGFLILRMIQGFCFGAAFPAMHCMIAKWAPPQELFVIGIIVYSGYNYGYGMSFLLLDFIAENYGWMSLNYGFSVCCFIWAILWGVLVQDSPKKQIIISAEELKMLTRSIEYDDESKKRLPIPWKKIFKSLPFWAIVVAHTCYNSTLQNTYYANLKYMKNVLGFNRLHVNAVLGIPYLPATTFSIVFCKILDKSIQYKKISTVTGRKIALATSVIVPGICGILVCINGCAPDFVTVAFAISIICESAWLFGFYTNHIDISRKYAGTLLALTTIISTINQNILPKLIIFVIELYPIQDIICSLSVTNVIVYFIELITFLQNASGEEQHWN